MLIDHSSGVVFAGGLVLPRIPTTPHADLPARLASLDAPETKLNTVALKAWCPTRSVYPDLRGLHQTRDYLRWLDQFLSTSATAGLDMSGVLATHCPSVSGAGAAAATSTPATSPACTRATSKGTDALNLYFAAPCVAS